MSVEFVFIRHAQATHNVAAELYGHDAYMDPAHRDAPLTDEGHLQVARVRRRCEVEFTWARGDFAPNVVYCSPLKRCRQTLIGIIPAAEGWSVRLDDRLMEPQSHVCNHRAEMDTLAAECPASWNLDAVAEVNPKDAPESIIARIRAFTADVLARHPGERVLIIAHFTWIQNWFRIFKKEKVEPPNCGILKTMLPPREKLD